MLEAFADRKDVALQTARVHALCAAAAANDTAVSPEERPRRIERYASRAIELLAQCRAGKYPTSSGHLDKLPTDPDWAALRGRKEFQQLQTLKADTSKP